MFNKYKKLKNQINNLKDSNKCLNNELYDLKNTVSNHYKFKILFNLKVTDYYGNEGYKFSVMFFFDKETAIEFVKDNLSNKDEPIILDLKTGKAIDFIQLKEKK